MDGIGEARFLEVANGQLPAGQSPHERISVVPVGARRPWPYKLAATCTENDSVTCALNVRVQQELDNILTGLGSILDTVWEDSEDTAYLYLLNVS